MTLGNGTFDAHHDGGIAPSFESRSSRLKRSQGSMARHRYRITQPLPWIKGGRPGAHFTWIGGTPIVAQPGMTMFVDDRELADNVVPCLEATDAAGRALLARARAAREAPVTRTAVADLHPNAKAWLTRATDEKLREQGRILELVLRMLERGQPPTRADFHAATVQAGDAIPAALKDHALKVFRQRQRPGPKQPRRTTWQDLEIQAHFQYELHYARQLHDANSRQPRSVKDVAARATARAFTLSKRTVERILASFAKRPWLRDDPPV
jgi:hypothetical protein